MASGMISKPYDGVFKRSLTTGDDLNSLVGANASGLYQIQSGVSNAPSDWSWLVVTGGTGSSQLVITATRLFFRAYTGTPLAWTAWRKVTNDDEYFTNRPITYVTNSIVGENALYRCRCASIGRFATFYMNLHLGPVSTSDFVKIGTCAINPYVSVLASVPIQDTTDNATFEIATNGDLLVYKPNTSTGFVRGCYTFGLETV